MCVYVSIVGCNYHEELADSDLWSDLLKIAGGARPVRATCTAAFFGLCCVSVVGRHYHEELADSDLRSDSLLKIAGGSRPLCL